MRKHPWVISHEKRIMCYTFVCVVSEIHRKILNGYYLAVSDIGTRMGIIDSATVRKLNDKHYRMVVSPARGVPCPLCPTEEHAERKESYLVGKVKEFNEGFFKLAN